MKIEQELFFVSGIVPPTTLYKLLRVMEMARARDVKVLPVIPPGEAVVKRGRPALDIIEHISPAPKAKEANGKATAKTRAKAKPRGGRRNAQGEQAVMGLKAFIQTLFIDNPTIHWTRKELMQRAEKKGFRPRSVDGSLDQLRKADFIQPVGTETGIYQMVPVQHT